MQYSLETQSKPTYATSSNTSTTGAGISTIAHENAHMWFGDDLTLSFWRDIWNNEGMTEFNSWLWQERENAGTTLDARYATNYTNSTSGSFWNVAPANPLNAAQIFTTSAMYTRGATTMVNIMRIMGEQDFRDMMHDWLNLPGHPYGNGSTEEFIAHVKAADLVDQTAEALPDRTTRWTEFFRQWLYTPFTGSPANGNKPSINKDNFDTFVLP